MSSCFTDSEVARKHEGRCRNLYMCALQCVSGKTHVQALLSSGSVWRTFALMHFSQVPSWSPCATWASIFLVPPSLYLKKQENGRCVTLAGFLSNPNGAIRIPLVRSKVWRATWNGALQTVCLTCDLSTSCRSEWARQRSAMLIFIFVWVVIVLGLNECIFLSFLWLCSKLETHPAYKGGVAPTCLISLVQDKKMAGWLAGWNSCEFAFRIWNNLMRMGIEIFSSEYEPCRLI